MWEVCPLIAVESISKTYNKKKVLDDINIEIAENQVFSIIGKNGSGKSTLLSIMAGVLKPDRGNVYFSQNSIFDKGVSRQIGFVSQYDSLFEDLSVKDNIKFWAAASGVRLNKLDENTFVKLLGVEEFKNKKVKALSVGMKKRVSICIALINDPKFIILDEPFSGLDLYYKSELINSLKGLKGMGKTIVYTSHNSDEIIDLSDYTCVINDSKIIFNQKTQALLSYGNNINNILMKLIKGEKIGYE